MILFNFFIKFIKSKFIINGLFQNKLDDVTFFFK